MQCMGAVRMRFQTADKNITILKEILTIPDDQLTSCQVKSCIFLRNKCIKVFLTLNRHFCPKYMSIINNTASSSGKIIPLLSSHVKIHQHVCLEQFLLVNSAVYISLLNQMR